MRTLKEYMQNPVGNKAAVMTNRKMYEDLYQDKWDKLMTRENGHIDYALYTSKKGEYIAHLKIPSETIEKFYYDVVIKLNVRDSVKTLENGEVTFFSNDPAFNFTWAYAFKKHGLTIKELEDKMSKTAIRKAPNDTNPDKSTGYVKTLYFAYIYLKSHGLLNKLRFETEAKKVDWRKIKQDIENTDKKVNDRIEAAKKLEKKKKEEPKAGTTVSRREDIFNPELRKVHRVNFIGNINKIGKNRSPQSIKRTKTIGKVKKR